MCVHIHAHTQKKNCLYKLVSPFIIFTNQDKEAKVKQMAAAYEKLCEKFVNEQKILYPCCYECPDYSSGYWLCSSTPMTKKEAVEWFTYNTSANYANEVKIETSVPGPIGRFFNMLNPFSDILYVSLNKKSVNE